MYPNPGACPEIAYAQKQADSSADMAALNSKYAPVLAAVSETIGKPYGFNDDLFVLFVSPTRAFLLLARVRLAFKLFSQPWLWLWWCTCDCVASLWCE